MWALLILPQQRRMRKHQDVISTLRVGDEVVTAGGVYGTIASVDEETLAVDVAPGVVLRVLRSAVSQRVGPLDDDSAEDDPSGGDSSGGDTSDADSAGGGPSRTVVETGPGAEAATGEDEI